MRQWCDEVMRKDDKVMSKVAVLGLMQDDDGGDAEEVARVEWARQRASI